MKRFFWWLLVGSGLAACQSGKSAAGPSASEVARSRVFQLPYQQATSLATSGSRVQATLTEVDESRCPQGVTCVWAGEVKVTLTLTDAAATQTLRLTRSPQQADSAKVTLNKQVYWLRLLDVTPYPSETNGGERRVAAVRLRKE